MNLARRMAIRHGCIILLAILGAELTWIVARSCRIPAGYWPQG